ncbi:hypothetical protein FB45DRAFT_531692 [Roridomyces roridus]|uniref:Transcription factor domain-containing protein n=1 Tax=Roridomyces roridus TaxID=1738132 RepID=A0AAD7FN94_9AGAR|nr:hypothetical protein FB45DRAFT_531692 [Roridomyces roridus]
MYLDLDVRFIQYHRNYVEDERWNRAFWCIILDGKLSTFLGRTPSLHADSEDFDVAPPLEVDHEYWEFPHGFLQPSALLFFPTRFDCARNGLRVPVLETGRIQILTKTLRRLCSLFDWN